MPTPRPIEAIAADMAPLLVHMAHRSKAFRVVTNEEIAKALSLAAEYEAAVKAIEAMRVALGAVFPRVGK